MRCLSSSTDSSKSYYLANDLRANVNYNVARSTPIPQVASLNLRLYTVCSRAERHPMISLERPSKTLASMRVAKSNWRIMSRYISYLLVHARIANRHNVQLVVKIRSQAATSILPTKAGKVTVKGSNANVSHTINEDERSEFTAHINGVGIPRLDFRSF